MKKEETRKLSQNFPACSHCTDMSMTEQPILKEELRAEVHYSILKSGRSQVNLAHKVALNSQFSTLVTVSPQHTPIISPLPGYESRILGEEPFPAYPPMRPVYKKWQRKRGRGGSASGPIVAAMIISPFSFFVVIFHSTAREGTMRF